jgi:hypothetical protein
MRNAIESIAPASTVAQENHKPPEVVMNETTGPDPAAVPELIAPPTLAPTETPVASASPPAPRRKHWMRFVWDTNPCYLLSAASLLYGVFLVSNGSKVFTTETSQLAFNFGALQFYGFLLVSTAILLVRRFIWYDSTLLVCLENALALVPFILVTQAALIEQQFVWGYCAAGLLLVSLRFGALRRWFHQLNLPVRVLGCGALVLAVNAALPVIYRHLHESKVGTKVTEGAAYEFNHWCWLVLLPAVIAIANLFPKPTAKGEHDPQRRWLPMMFFAFWLTATVTHLYSLGYVYDFDLRRAWVAPAVWALAWTLYLRISDFIEFPGWKLNRFLLFVPVLTPFVAGLANSKITFTLAAMNAAAYALACINGSQPRLVRNLAIASALTVIAAIPHAWGAMVIPGFNPAKAVAAAGLASLILPALFSRNPTYGVLGALAVAGGVAGFGEPLASAGHWSGQAGCVFFLLHSLRWLDGNEKGLAAARLVISSLWLAHAFIWAHLGGPGWGLALLGGTVGGAWLVARYLDRVRGLWGMGTMAGLVTVSSPLDAAGQWMAAAPAGLLAVAGSFALFALGTAAALFKHRGQKSATG